MKALYGVFSHDVTAAILVSQNNETAAMLVSQNNETAAMLVSQNNPLGVVLLSYANDFFFLKICIDAGHVSEKHSCSPSRKRPQCAATGSDVR